MIHINKLDVLFVPVTFLTLAFFIWTSDNNSTIFLYINAIPLLANKGLWANITILGDALILFSFLAIFVIYKPRWVVAGVIAAIISGIVVQMMKYGFDIDRPIAILERTKLFLVGNPPSSRAFPSGHTASIFLFAGIIFFGTKNKTIAVIVLSLAIIVGISRIMVAAHWPLDLLVGASIGWLSAYVGIYISNTFKNIKKSIMIILNLIIFTSSITLFFHNTTYEQAFILQIIIASCMTPLTIYNFYSLKL